ncbi:MAG: tRNA dihydrouridine synthase DusB [Oscillospiraceae bacterium]|nr:tRNA dihydrouridine synthase DusB [Oscillospiraceae bacterium]
MRVGDIEITSKSYLAPMAGVCDLAFRSICRSFGAGMTCSEMVSAKALVFGDEKTKTLLALAPDEHPAAVQIFGHEPDCMERAAALAAEVSGADIIDINMGCPVGKIVKNGDGCALMRDIPLAAEIVRAVRRGSGEKPVTVKFRKGWDGGSVNAVEFARALEDAGASALAVHGRTRVQMYSGVADWNIIRDVKAAVSIPVVGNGDVFSADDALRMLRCTNADAVMVGRGAFGNPWIFGQINAALAGLPVPEPPALSERLDTAVRHIELAAKLKGERVACLEARKHYAWYLKGVPHAGAYRSRIVQVSTLDDIYRITEQIKTELG